MEKVIRKFYLLQIIRSENRKGLRPSISFIISKLEDRFVDSKTAISERTIKRDIKEIRDELHIPIRYIGHGYEIAEDEYENSIVSNTVEAFEIFSSVNLQTGMPDFVLAENRKPTGNEHFHFLVKAILANSEISFIYRKYFPEEESQIFVAPYALKESRNRWYLIGVKRGENELKAFGLDRISFPAREDLKFKPKFSVEEVKAHFADSFAMFTDAEVEKVILKFDKRDGNYIKSFPIHLSQTVTEDKNSVTVTLQIRITLDFMMELMSRAWSLEVIEPLSLREKLAGIFKDAVGRNG